MTDWHLVCCIDECDSKIVGLNDGWEPSSRDGVVCSDCWNFNRDHGHWPDEETQCIQCRKQSHTESSAR